MRNHLQFPVFSLFSEGSGSDPPKSGWASLTRAPESEPGLFVGHGDDSPGF